MIVRSKYVHPQAFVYYALSLPALISLFLFLTDVAREAGQFPIPFAGEQISLLVQSIIQYLPFIAVAVYVYALITFHPSSLVSLLTLSFFVLTVISTQVNYSSALVVVLSCFSCLIGFNYARAAKVLSGRQARVRSTGRWWAKLVSVGFDLVLPFALAFGLVALDVRIISAMQAEAAILPEPGATLATLYLSSHIYLVFTILTVAGITVWAMRNLIEPIIMWFTFTLQDSVREARAKLEFEMAKLELEASNRPGRGLKWVILSLLLAAGLGAYLVLNSGPDGVTANLFSVIGLGKPTPNIVGLKIEGTARNFVRLADYWTKTVENLVKLVMRILWG